MTPFRERNPIPIAIGGIVLIIVLVLLAFNAKSLPFIGGGTGFEANFTDASGLNTGDDVRLAGVKIGTVSSVSLDGTVVQVGFTIKGVTLGDQTTAEIKIKTLLGQKYVALDSAGNAPLRAGAVIPVDRTTTPFDVTTAFSGLSQHIEAIDTGQLAKAFSTLAATFQNSPSQVKSSLVGLERLSTTIASRDAQLGELLGHAHNVTGVLAARDAQVTRLIDDGNTVLALVESQRMQIHDLLVNTSALAVQLTALVRENQAVIGPALTHLQSVATILVGDQSQLDNAVHLLAPFVRDFTNTLGSGQWFDTVVTNLNSGLAGFTAVPTQPGGGTH